ncbi:ABC transporter substrate-binding protein [Vibrio gallicus]|uniref:ABC transporter substrate-binding protein n=1 Tax=Vibrio gallicus TaxID=190897 RepID=UPI0021C3759E|nr:ABC transporter substrate-binding protein [Vibrio gallicus]
MKRFGLLLVGLFSSVAWAHYPLTVTDGNGTAVTIAKKPQRISSKTLFSDEVLNELVAYQRLTSVTNLVDNPNFSNVAHHYPNDIPRMDMNVERILVNKPDVVFAANWSDPSKVAQLRAAGITVFILPTPNTLDQIEDLIELVGDIVGEEDKAETIVIGMQENLQRFLIPARKPIRVIDYNNWGSSSTKHSTWQLIIDEAGFKNATESFEGDKYGQTPLSKEMLIALNPDVMFLPSWVYGNDEAADKFLENVLDDPSLKGITAIEKGDVFQMPESLRGTYSQYIVDSIIYVNHAVLGEAAP